MTDNTQNNNTQFINPLQTNNSALALVGYLAGIAAAKIPIFDFVTWNYIFMSIGGILFTTVPLIINRKTAVITTTANMPEVKKDGGIILDKSAPAAKAIEAATPANVVAQ